MKTAPATSPRRQESPRTPVLWLITALVLLLPCGARADGTQLTFDPAWDRTPAWSPDGNQIAFASDRSGNWDVWVIPATGGVATQITFDPTDDGAPCWSPDGAQIAISSERSGNSDIWAVPATGGAATQITIHPGIDRDPDWSPDGNQVAFASDRSGNFNIWVIPDFGYYDAVETFVNGRNVALVWVLQAITELTLFKAAVVLGLAILLFYRREVAEVSI